MTIAPGMFGVTLCIVRDICVNPFRKIRDKERKLLILQRICYVRIKHQSPDMFALPL